MSQPNDLKSVMTPKEIVHELDKFIIGQKAAKKAVAIALRNRWRRQNVDAKLRDEITPKNILMIGPTGVGKTEIARRLGQLAQAPLVKEEASKFTQVGYVGRDVEEMIRRLMDVGIKMVREEEMKKVRTLAEEAAEERVLDALLPTGKNRFVGEPPAAEEKEETSARQLFRKKLRDGELDEQVVEVEVSAPSVGVEIMAPPGMEEMTSQLQSMFQNMAGDKTKTRKVKVKDAIKQLTDDEASKMLNEDEIRSRAVTLVEQSGIVFIDELDKIVQGRELRGTHDPSGQGVQRDLLPIIEGSTVTTKYGPVRTDHILFIGAGAFHLAKPSDLIPELQGRFPIRVELDALSAEDFVRILTEPNASLTEQYTALMGTEGLKLEFSQDGIQRIAEIAYQVNETTENIGARRLHTVLERLLEIISFEASDRAGENHQINQDYVDKQLADLVKNEDLSRYIL